MTEQHREQAIEVGRKSPAGPRRYRVRVSPQGKFRWNHGQFLFALSRKAQGVFLWKEVIL